MEVIVKTEIRFVGYNARRAECKGGGCVCLSFKEAVTSHQRHHVSAKGILVDQLHFPLT